MFKVQVKPTKRFKDKLNGLVEAHKRGKRDFMRKFLRSSTPLKEHSLKDVTRAAFKKHYYTGKSSEGWERQSSVVTSEGEVKGLITLSPKSDNRDSRGGPTSIIAGVFEEGRKPAWGNLDKILLWVQSKMMVADPKIALAIAWSIMHKQKRRKTFGTKPLSTGAEAKRALESISTRALQSFTDKAHAYTKALIKQSYEAKR